jgi:hypothetical protein
METPAQAAGDPEAKDGDLDNPVSRAPASLATHRHQLALEFVHADLKYRAHVGFFANGNQPAELFLDSSKPNSAIDAFASDAAILISLLLQRGSSVTEIGHALRRTPNGEAASLIGAAIDELSKLPPTASEPVA